MGELSVNVLRQLKMMQEKLQQEKSTYSYILWYLMFKFSIDLPYNKSYKGESKTDTSVVLM